MKRHIVRIKDGLLFSNKKDMLDWVDEQKEKGKSVSHVKSGKGYLAFTLNKAKIER